MTSLANILTRCRPAAEMKAHTAKLTIFIVVAALLVAGCGGSHASSTSAGQQVAPTATADSTTTSNPPTSTASDASSASIPDGWKPFEEGAYSGAVPQTWDIAVLDGAMLIDASNPFVQQLPQETQQALQGLFATGRFHSVVFAFIDRDPGFATNINMLGCFNALEVAPENKEVATMAELGFNAEKKGQVVFAGRLWNLTKVYFTSLNDSYEVMPHLGSCYLTITLSTKPGDETSLPDFETFLKLLEVDVSQLSD